MSVSPYSVQHDPEVQEYNKRFSTWKASEKSRKQEEKLFREQAKRDRRAALKQIAKAERAEVGKAFGWVCQKDRSKTEVVSAKKLDGDSDSDELSVREALAV
ncbi:uncharacterized protein Z519_02252 [Cladophialophora bantiana CBS 173.52]|uniref:Uncharacterized protein n=1 Tax=Cladophialophora bantiana (strain ATCC 10958 / CBS 173.52 / CDC B-1940 / NIH 8579) TaxID=1442370 RepID=A0A0D2F3N1_CLAB1|nr:uncharacterized protein Z519_02252 [Cladophialophora bantiana CBS 173.52]KIW96861.1 hypothetical protein Z519_02252 [Cladophialophora bantiana CBS 173.52]